MKMKAYAFVLFLLLPLAAGAQQGKLYRWVDADGVVHYGDKVAAEFSELPKEVVNDQGVALEHLAGKKSADELEAERLAAELGIQQEMQKRADRTLVMTYQNVDEIEMHRDRRLELFQAQSRVTELYLRNQRRSLERMENNAARFQPYSTDPNAPMISNDLAKAIDETRNTIARHEHNLLKYQSEEQQIIAGFRGDIERFKILKGIE
jgi:hypothetical protein